MKSKLLFLFKVIVMYAILAISYYIQFAAIKSTADPVYPVIKVEALDYSV
ncbi:hypothetical protein [Paenibacillus senegalimassiliensis]|nr:hypothetical protein [Paenibacillus senegalimassiliensis]